MFAEVCDLFLARDRVAATDTPRLAHWLVAASRLADLAEGRPLRHGMRVAMVAYHLAKLSGLSLEDTSTTVQAALLHDVGHLPLLPRLAKALPPILNEKQLLAGHRAWQHGLTTWPVSLTDQARQTLERHPHQAKALLQEWRVSHETIQAVMAHHEQWNGNGYPAGLSGDAIPYPAQLAAMADLLEGLMTPNHTPAQREQHIRAVLNSPAHIHWNPALSAMITGPFFEDPWWYRDLFSTEAEIWQLLPQEPLHPAHFLAYSRQVSQWVEDLAADCWQGHSLRVAENAQRVAAALTIDSTQQGQLILAVLWHEAGKLAWPVSLWQKPDPLNQNEWQMVTTHPQLAAEVLSVIPGCEAVASWIAEHHERMNGSGYPGGQKGVQISVAARLLALCDVFDALTHARPYRVMAYSATEALSLMAEQRNRLFDPNLYNLFKDVVLQHTTVFSQMFPEPALSA